MTAPLLLVAQPEVWTDRADDLPKLLEDIETTDPEAFVLLLPRGIASPARIAYLSGFCNQLRNLDYMVEHQELRIDGRKRRVVVGQRKDRGRRPQFPADLGQLILANQ